MPYNFHSKGLPKFRHLAILAISGGYFGYFGFLTPAGFFSPYPGNNLHTHRYKIQRVLVFALAPNVHFYLCLAVGMVEVVLMFHREPTTKYYLFLHTQKRPRQLLAREEFCTKNIVFHVAMESQATLSFKKM